MSPLLPRRRFLFGLVGSSLSTVGRSRADVYRAAASGHRSAAGVQTSGLSWTTTRGADGDDRFTSVVPAHDGGWLLAGRTRDSTSKPTAWLAIVDDAGRVRDEQRLEPAGGTRSTEITDLRRTADGYLLAGTTGPRDLHERGWFAGLDADRCPTTATTHRPRRDIAVHQVEVVRLADGGVALAGTVRTPETDSTWVAGFDPDGERRWTRYYADDYRLGFLLPDSDGGCVVGGHFAAGGGWLAGLSASGQERWLDRLSLRDGNSPTDAVRTSDGGYVVAGDEGLYRYDAAREAVWRRTGADLGLDEPSAVRFTAVERASDGGYVVAGGDGGSVHVATVATDGTLQRTVTASGDVVVGDLATRGSGWALAGEAGSHPADGWAGGFVGEGGQDGSSGATATTSVGSCVETVSFRPPPTPTSTATPADGEVGTPTTGTAGTTPSARTAPTDASVTPTSGRTGSIPGFGVSTALAGLSVGVALRAVGSDEDQ